MGSKRPGQGGHLIPSHLKLGAENQKLHMTLINKIIYVLCLIPNAFITCISVKSPFTLHQQSARFQWGWGENEGIMLYDKT